ncbi:MAG TPA: ABC transporter permease, partial [Ktedonobacterales bacterium]
NPRGPSRLTALLALALGLGLFALTVNGSLERNASNRAAFQVGADVRVIEGNYEPPDADARIRTKLATFAGVEGTTPIYRANINLNGTSDAGPLTGNLLGIDPSSWARVAGATSWRDDYADTPLATLMTGLRQHQWQGSSALGDGQIGDAKHPLWTLVSQSLADTLHLHVGDRFPFEYGQAQPTPSNAQVGAIVQAFPTLYPNLSQGGYLVVSLPDATAGFIAANGGDPNNIGPSEYWLRTDGSATHQQAFAAELARDASALDIVRTVDRRVLEDAIATNPVQVGVRGLLLLGAIVAAALALLGSVLQAALSARQRVVRFAVLRTLGMASRQLTGLLLCEQLVVYTFGLVGGTALGLLLAGSTLPYLQFGDTTIDPTTLGVPPYVLSIDPAKVAIFYAFLLGSFALALGASAFYATTVGLGKALRLGED